MNIDVLKFGGTSMADHTTWKKVLHIISQYEYPVVVVSATARTTRQLLQSASLAARKKTNDAHAIVADIEHRHVGIIEDFLAENESSKNELIKESCLKHIQSTIGFLKKLLSYIEKQGEVDPAMQDAVLSIGEQISSYLLAQCGLATGQLTQHVEARKIIKTDNEYGKANPNLGLITQHAGALETMLENGFTPIIGGFYGEGTDKNITTLGFEGSDYTASLIGGAIEAQSIEIWTDVSGVYTSDPRFIPDARPISELSYLDATEMAYFGARVLHPSTLKPAQEKNIPVHVKNMFQPQDPGTRIIRKVEHKKDVLAISFKKDLTILTVSAYETLMGYSFLTKVFQVLEKYRLPVDAVNTTEASVSIALANHEKLDTLTDEFIELGSTSLTSGKGLISVIGCNHEKAKQVIKHISDTQPHIHTDLISFSRDKRILNIVLNDEYLVEAAQQIHTSCF